MEQNADQRKNDRSYPLKSTDIEIKGTSYRINDISTEGIGLVVDDSSPTLFMGQRIESIPISVQAKTLCLSGVVAHISKTKDGCVCGIRFLFVNAKEFEHAKSFMKDRTHSEVV